VPNRLHILMASNSNWVVPASSDERRYLVLDVLGIKQGNRPYFAAIEEEMENGGLAAMLHDLLARDISAFEIRDVPQTAGLRHLDLHPSVPKPDHIFSDLRPLVSLTGF